VLRYDGGRMSRIVLVTGATGYEAAIADFGADPGRFVS
jgi:hypothetical protein